VVGGKTGKCYNYAIRLSAEVGPCEGGFLSPSCLFSPLFLEGNFPNLVSGLQKVSTQYSQFAELRAKTRHFGL